MLTDFLNFVDRSSKVNIFRWYSLVFNWFASTVCWERYARICLWTGICKRSLIKYRAMPLITRDEKCYVAASHAVSTIRRIEYLYFMHVRSFTHAAFTLDILYIIQRWKFEFCLSEWSPRGIIKFLKYSGRSDRRTNF